MRDNSVEEKDCDRGLLFTDLIFCQKRRRRREHWHLVVHKTVLMFM